MLSIFDPLQLEGVAVFRDDEDPKKFYLVPDAPRLGADDRGKPTFWFVRYRYSENVTSRVLLHAVVAIDPARRQRIVEQLRAITSSEPVLGAPAWTSGALTLDAFAAADGKLSRKSLPGADGVSCDLAGAFGASFDVEIDATATAVFWAPDAQPPLGLQYRLTYVARAGAEISIRADRARLLARLIAAAMLYKLAGGRWEPSGDAAAGTRRISAATARQALQKMIAGGEIEIAGGAGPTAALQRLAADLIADRVLPLLFGDALNGEPTVNPTDPQSDPFDLANRTFALNGGAPPATGDALELRVSATTSFERALYLYAPLRRSCADTEQYRSCFWDVADEDSVLVPMKTVLISTAGVDFERDGIDAVFVRVQYNQVDANYLFDGLLKAATESCRFEFSPVRDASGKLIETYQFRIDVISHGEKKFASDWRSTSETLLTLDAAGMGLATMRENPPA